MGNVPPPPRDYRIDRCYKFFQLTDPMLRMLWRKFYTLDLHFSGYISINDFVTKFLKLPNSCLIDEVINFLWKFSILFIDVINQLYGIVDSSSETDLSFGEVFFQPYLST